MTISETKARVVKLFRQHWVLILPILIMALLLAKNPFSDRNLIPNLEPYPDAFHYISPAFAVLKGYGFNLEREGRTIQPTVPPGYTIALIPVFVFIKDARAFYLTNVILLFISLGLFYAIVRKAFPNQFIQFLLLSLFGSNLGLAWYAGLPMAENLTTTLFLGGVLLLNSKINKTRAACAALIGVSFYATKYASLSLSLAFPVLYGLKAALAARKSRIILPDFIFYLVTLASFGGCYLLFELLVRNNNVIGGLFALIVSVFGHATVEASAPATTAGTFFSAFFVRQNLNSYFGWLTGKNLIVLWRPTQILPPWLAWPALIGFVVALWNKQQRALSLNVMALIGATIAVMAFFYTTDGRYLFMAIPSLMLGVGFILSWVQLRLPKTIKPLYFNLGVLAITGLALTVSAKDLKYTIAVNLRHAETPWYHISVERVDDFIGHLPPTDQKPVLITSLPPYYLDYFTHHPMIIMPLDNGQEFRSNPKEAWGDINFEHLHLTYQTLLNQGHPVYAMTYGLGNTKFLHKAFEDLSLDFNVTKVEDGCFTQCEIYQLTNKVATPSAKLSGSKQ